MDVKPINGGSAIASMPSAGLLCTQRPRQDFGMRPAFQSHSARKLAQRCDRRSILLAIAPLALSRLLVNQREL